MSNSSNFFNSNNSLNPKMNTKLYNILNRKQIEQLTDEWFKVRYKMITASECSSVLECNP